MTKQSERPVIYVAGGYASGMVAQAIKEQAERTGARIVGKLDLPRPSIAPHMLAAITGDLDAVSPEDAERARQIMGLRLNAPKRSEAGKPVEQQQDAAHLPLFVHANEPKLF